LLVGEVIQNLMFERQLKNLSYKPTEERFSGTARSINLAPLENKKALIVGAGALGNFLGLGLTHTNLSDIYLVDDDVIETTNLNRQIMFYNAVGEYKAEVLAKRINEINPNVRVHPIMERVNENFEDQIKTINPDVLIDCVDNLGTRAVLNHFAIRYGIPLISGGTDYNAGQVVVYEPGKSSCLDCKLGTDRALLQERQSMSCMNAPTQSVVITNHIIGGLMAAETRCVLSPGDYGPAVRKTIKYDSTKGARIGLIGTQEPCKCERGITAQTWIKNLESKAS